MINPIAIDFGIVQIRWYGILMALGFLIGLIITIKLAKTRKIDKELIYDYFVWLIPSSIIGARLLSVLLDFSYYLDNPLNIFAVWHGGMAIHGGIIGAVIATHYFTKKRKLNFYDLSDILVIPLSLGLAIGRIGNFINQEFYGKPTNLPWGIYFDNIQEKRHPSQIYESIKNLFIFFITLQLYFISKLKKGTITWIFILLYSILRFGVEFFKDVQTYNHLTYGQLISIPLIILSIVMLIKIAKK